MAPVRANAPELLLRVCSALVLAPLAVVVAYLGGWLFAAFWAAAGLGTFWEWNRMIGGTRPVQIVGLAALAGAAILLVVGQTGGAAVLIVASAALAATVFGTKRLWAGAGIVYAGLLILCPIWLRSDADFGFTAIALLFGVVWATDILGYFVGRLVGGPKLWPRVSPKKTWSGAIGGMLGAVIAAWTIARSAGLANASAVVVLALLLSAVSQGGDFFESAVKRHFGVKDAGQAIPGHGGFMDRLDGFLAAAALATIIGVVRSIDAPARGLLVW